MNSNYIAELRIGVSGGENEQEWSNRGSVLLILEFILLHFLYVLISGTFSVNICMFCLIVSLG